jgi:hypothetical protein
MVVERSDLGVGAEMGQQISVRQSSLFFDTEPRTVNS